MTEVQVLLEITIGQILLRKITFCGSANNSTEKRFKSKRNNKEKAHAIGDSDKQHTERKPRKCYDANLKIT